MHVKFLLKKAIIPFSVLIIFSLIIGAYIREKNKILHTPIHSWIEDNSADCAVVLTGGPGRVREGFDLLSQKKIQKLIITGVNPHVWLKDIFPQWLFYGDLDETSVILERRSTTTYGNAQQSLPLIEALLCHDLILITSNLHIHRAAATFHAVFPPDFPIYPRSVFTSTEMSTSWDFFVETIKSLFYTLWVY